MTQLLTLPADDPGLDAAIGRMLGGGPPVAPLPAELADPVATLAMLRPDEPVAEPDAGLIVATSGSTGEPKGVVLSRAAITAAAAATHARLGGPGNWTLALPAHYVAGVMVIARALTCGGTVFRAAADLSDLPPAGAGELERSYLSLVPTQLVRALAHPELVARLVDYDAILLGGAALDPSVLETARSAGLRIVTTYGMSETSGGCVYDGHPLDGVEVHLAGDGRVSISGPVLFSGYRLRPDLTAEVLIGDRLRTRDRAVWDGDPCAGARLHVMGRIDDIVISGGVNVDLAEVEQALQQIDPHATAVGVPDPEWGTRIVAALTVPTTLADLRERLPHLDAPARPRGVLRHPHLPLTSSGKIDRQELVAWWESGPAEKEEM
ncbi:MAG: AMP-binding protein [Propionibacteriaceae bacterium]|nr:AMP-binding protein [Propionibacteriaceae bacterium]